MKKRRTVFEAAQERIHFCFDRFEQVVVSYSGGKDSGVLLNLALDIAAERGRRLGVFHVDYEAQYQATTDHVRETFESLPAFCDKFWVCLPLSVPCATSMSQNHWVPWSQNERHLWVRDLPAGCIHQGNMPFDFFKPGMADYDFQKEFGDWLYRSTGRCTACLIGSRSEESYDRRIMLANTVNRRKYPGVLWSTGGKGDHGKQYNFYPIHDWTVDDVWIYFGRTGRPYNKLYDLMHLAGVPIHRMRVASPFISQGIENLKLYRAIEPDTWGKLVSRVNGVNFSGIYGGTTAMGWKSITKPPGHTWKSYLEFLLSTLPPATRENYEKRFKVSENFSTTQGGVLDEGTIEEIQASGVPVRMHAGSRRKTTKRTVVFEEYPDDMEITEFRDVPSYKRMVVCVLKNDHLCKYMGFTLTKKEQERRHAVIERYKQML